MRSDKAEMAMEMFLSDEEVKVASELTEICGRTRVSKLEDVILTWRLIGYS